MDGISGFIIGVLVVLVFFGLFFFPHVVHESLLCEVLDAASQFQVVYEKSDCYANVDGYQMKIDEDYVEWLEWSNE